jgi:O-antigen/teichoic acid export membrane protein
VARNRLAAASSLPATSDSLRLAVTRVASGTLVAQTAALAVSPVVSRLFTPADFGAFAVYVATLGVLIPVASLRYEMAVPVAADDDEAASVFRLAATVLLAVVAVCSAAAILRAPVATLLGLPATSLVPLLLPVGLLVAGLVQLTSAWAIRRKAYAGLAVSRMAQGTTQAGAQVLAGGVAVPAGLLGADILGRLAGLFMLARRTDAPWRRWTEPGAFAAMRRAASRYRGFATLTGPAGLFNALVLALPAVMIVRLFGADAGGGYGFGIRLFAAPLTLASQAVGQVFQAEAASVLREGGNALALFDRAASRLIVGGLLLAGVALAAPWFFPPLFGPEWEPAGRMMRLLAPTFAAEAVVSPLSMSAILAQRPELELDASVLRVVVVVAVFVAATIGSWSLSSTLLVYAAAMVATYVVFFVLYRRSLGIAAAVRERA